MPPKNMHAPQAEEDVADKGCLFELSNISKTFGGNVVLDNVSLKLFPGSVHALMGENGAGKSTLMKILAGVLIPDCGDIYKRGNRLNLSTPKEALDFGISTVFQELSLLSNLSIAENMFLGRELTTKAAGLDYLRMNQQTNRALKKLGLELDPKTLVRELSIAERQLVEIAHGIKAEVDVIILDEPTAALNTADVAMLNSHIRKMKEQHKAIVYISHRMEEVFAICDTVTVLKDGQHMATRPISKMTPQSLIALMVGREIGDLFPKRGNIAGEPVLEISNLKLGANTQPLSLTLHKGEIVALTGLEGQGQQAILRSLVGQYQPISGTMAIKGKRLQLPVSAVDGIRALQAMGVCFIPEDRQEEGLFSGLSITHNLSIGLHTSRGTLLARRYQAIISTMMKSMNITASADTRVNTLSGGNQQKVLLGRYFATDADVLLLEEPTRGVDVGAKAEIYKLLRHFTNSGGTAIVLSRETIELIGLCDRLIIIHAQTLVGEMEAQEATEHKILDATLVE